jgi:hypothetical protein
MSKTLLAAAAILTVIVASLASSLTARAQSAARIEYARVTPYIVRLPLDAHSVQERHGYRACVASMSEWACREFAPTDSSSAALRTTLATLGSEGWELVSAVNEDPTVTSPIGLTYLFKRQVR